MTKLLASILLLLVPCMSVSSQIHGAGKKADIKEGLGSTWKGPSNTLISRLLLKKKAAAEPASVVAKRRLTAIAPSPPPTASITFRPGPNAGVDQALATAFASTPTEKQALLELFAQVKQSYETEVAKDGKSNNLAAAMTFFIASNVVAYHRTPMPSDEVTEELFASLRDLMAGTPEITKMTNAEKQQMHDWLVYMGGFVLASHLSAKETNDRDALDNAGVIAALSTKIVLGVDLSQLSFSKNGFTVSGGTAVNSPPPVSSSTISSSEFLDFDPFPDKPYVQPQKPLTGGLRKTITTADLAGTWEIGGASVMTYVSSGNSSYTSTSFFGKKYTISSNGSYNFKFQGRASNTTIRETDIGTVILSGGFITMKSNKNPAMRYQFVAFMTQPNGASVLSLIYIGDGAPLDGNALVANCSHPNGYVSCLNGEEWVRIP